MGQPTANQPITQPRRRRRLDPQFVRQLAHVQPGISRSSTTSARNCGSVTASSTAAIDLDATATSARDDSSTASVTASSSASIFLRADTYAYYNY